MKLKNILIGLEGLKAKGDLDKEILGIDSNSKNIKNGFMFVAIKGYSVDGHNFIEEAIKNGAIVVVIEEGFDIKSIKFSENVTIIVSKDTREFLAISASNFYDNPSRKFKLIGITGTKGKTTSTFMIKEILEKAGKKVGLIGTIAIYINGEKLKNSDRTTPESLELQQLFSKMVDEGVEYVVMEVSSQSLKLHRVDGCEFDYVAFTNFSEDHISDKEHPDIKDYFESKMKLFKMCKKGFVNIDDLQGAKIPALFPNSEIIKYGIDNSGDFLAKDITITNSAVDFKVKIGTRNERIKIDIPIMIDYAHSPESLQNILKAVKSYTRGKVISVFGCGGDRDSRKRPVMGEISGKIADYTIITSDNPRTEEPKAIVDQIEEGIKKTKGKYEVILDRKEAIKKAIKMASKADIIVLAGKGHEPYQEINGVKYDFDERIIVKEIIDNK